MLRGLWRRDVGAGDGQSALIEYPENRNSSFKKYAGLLIGAWAEVGENSAGTEELHLLLDHTSIL